MKVFIYLTQKDRFTIFCYWFDRSGGISSFRQNFKMCVYWHPFCLKWFSTGAHLCCQLSACDCQSLLAAVVLWCCCQLYGCSLKSPQICFSNWRHSSCYGSQTTRRRAGVWLLSLYAPKWLCELHYRCCGLHVCLSVFVALIEAGTSSLTMTKDDSGWSWSSTCSFHLCAAYCSCSWDYAECLNLSVHSASCLTEASCS